MQISYTEIRLNWSVNPLKTKYICFI
jgi:hypothetical protein